MRQTKFRSAKELRDTLYQYCCVYNHHIPQRNLGHITPISPLKKSPSHAGEILDKILSGSRKGDTSSWH